MRDVGMVDSRYRKLVDQMFEEICAEVPGFEVPKSHQESILISSPDAQVYYHADLPGPEPGFRSPAQNASGFIRTPRRSLPTNISKTSRCTMSGRSSLQGWYDDHAKVLDIGPGQMLGWQMNAPHRVRTSTRSATR